MIGLGMNPGNYQKTPLGLSLNRIARQSVGNEIQQQGKALPCSVVAVRGQIVTVKFEVKSTSTIPQVTIPIATSRYDWLPVQVGDTGVTMPADVYLGGISGLGGGVANMTPRANLTALVFVPCAQAAWTVPDINQRVVQGQTGVLLRDLADKCRLSLTAFGLTVTIGGVVVATIDVQGIHSPIQVTAGASPIHLTTHTHGDPQSGNTTSPIPGS